VQTANSVVQRDTTIAAAPANTTTTIAAAPATTTTAA
jgi:hypothetical protein